MAAMSEFRVAFTETFRFEWIVQSLSPSLDKEAESDEHGLWEWRTSVLAFLNALANSPELLEGRCEIRGELSRRGLGDIIDVSPSLSKLAYRY